MLIMNYLEKVKDEIPIAIAINKPEKVQPRSLQYALCNINVRN